MNKNEIDEKEKELDKLYRICEVMYERLIDLKYYKNDDIYNERWELMVKLDRRLGLLRFELGYENKIYCGFGEGEF